MVDTIYALSSGSLPAGVAVVRISGPMVQEIASVSFGRLPQARYAKLKTIRDRNGNFVDQTLVLWFPGPNSFTGEDCLELHCHGGRATIAALFGHLSSFAACRPAVAGEFTRRALMAGKMDLQEAESLGDVLAAETELERQLALTLASDSVRQQYQDWRQTLLRCMALLAADIDFVDEEDAPENVASQLAPDLSRLRNEILDRAGTIRESRFIRSGFRVALVGEPNAGKSSLFNALIGEERVIVSPIAGTTRDSVEAVIDLMGHKVVLVDTAGMRETDDAVEALGIERTRVELEKAHCIVAMADDAGLFPQLSKEVSAAVIRVRSKMDVPGHYEVDDSDVLVSSRTGLGLEALRAQIVKQVEAVVTVSADFALNERHCGHLRASAAALETALAGIAISADVELIAEDVRRAMHELECVTGHIGVEDVLGAVFSQFCIGK